MTEERLQTLACAVLKTAIDDAKGHVVGNRMTREEKLEAIEDAREFLRVGSADLEFWMDAAGVDAEVLAAAAEKRGRPFRDEYRPRGES